MKDLHVVPWVTMVTVARAVNVNECESFRVVVCCLF